MAEAAWLKKLPMDIIKRIAGGHSIDPMIIAGICMQESAGEIYALRYEPHYKWLCHPEIYSKQLRCSLETEQQAQRFSYGLMQVMGGVLREHGYKRWLGESFDPNINIHYGVKHFAKFMKQYGDVKLALASYNAGSPRDVAPKDGKIDNQYYVDAVLKFADQARGSR